MSNLRILAVEPFFGGSHKVFLEGLTDHSSHEFVALTESAHHWKWRYVSSGFHFAAKVKELASDVDLLFCSNVLDLFSLVALLPELKDLPKITYFHENQASYPVQPGKKRDMHYVIQDLKTIYASDLVLFNSQWNQSSLWQSSKELVSKLPDQGKSIAALLEGKTAQRVLPLGIELARLAQANQSKPSHKVPVILWNHRWEFDKNPELLYRVLKKMQSKKIAFKLIVCGEHRRYFPPVFDRIKDEFASELCSWGMLERDKYEAALQKADICLSTSDHEFFGISVCEAIASGCFPLLPAKLSYPELLPGNMLEQCLYASEDELVQKLEAKLLEFPFAVDQGLQKKVLKFDWRVQAPVYDKIFEDLVRKNTLEKEA